MKCEHVDAVWPQILDQVVSQPLRPGGQGDLKQLTGLHVVLDGSVEQFLLNPRRKLSPIYASAELLWYLSREKSIEMIQAYAPQYEKFSEDGVAYGAYGARLKENAERDLLESAINMLRERPHTKKCVVGLWRPSDLLRSGEHKDIPCTLSWQFLMDCNKLDMICTMRSNDLWKGFLYDVYVNTILHRYVAASIGVAAGNYHHIAGSMHLYMRDEKKALEAIVAEVRPTERTPPREDYAWRDDEIAVALEAERIIRESPDKNYFILKADMPAALADAVGCCSAKFGSGWGLQSPILQRAMEQFLCTKSQPT